MGLVASSGLRYSVFLFLRSVVAVCEAALNEIDECLLKESMGLQMNECCCLPLISNLVSSPACVL